MDDEVEVVTVEPAELHLIVEEVDEEQHQVVVVLT